MGKTYSREEIKNIVVYLEQKYPVNNWKHNGYYIWPVFRNALKNKLRVNKNRVRKNTKINHSKLNRLLQAFIAIKDLLYLNKNVKKIYFGSPSHCVNYNGFKYNRYFDPLMDMGDYDSLYISRSNSKKGVYRPDRHLLFNGIYLVFKVIDRLFKCFSSPIDHVDDLCDILETEGIRIDGINQSLKRNVKTVDISYALFQFLFKKLKPEVVLVLCYYSDRIFGMLIAAHKMSIPTIDMQHGGTGKYHLAYANWTKVPQNGYEALPNLFYTWDKTSFNVINAWAKNNKKHSAEVFGNPWVDGWKQKKFQQSSYDWPENIILYTLQPIGEPLEDYIMEAIQKTKNKWNWWLRIHPTQVNDKDLIYSRLKRFGVFDSVNIEEATFLPLPEILTHTAVHITKFSGSALEAYQFDVKSIIIDQRGVDIYEDYIDDGSVIVNLKENTHDLIKTIEEVFPAT